MRERYLPSLWNIFLIVISVFFMLPGCSHRNYAVKGAGGIKVNEWYAYVKDHRAEKAGDLFDVSDSLIRLYGEKPGYLMSKRSWSDFELKLEYRWNTEQKYYRNAKVKNSGVMYNVPDDAIDTLWPKGIQFQVKEGGTGDFILLGNVTLNVRGETKPPGASVNVARLSENDNATGQWNEIIIRSYHGKCTQYLNGKMVNEGTAASSASGRILLQYEGSPIDFRRILIKQL